jgi:hypothetical protein
MREAGSYRITSHWHELVLVRAEGSRAPSMLVDNSASINIMTTTSRARCSTQHIQTRAESERRVMKTIITRHAIWDRLLAATACVSGPFCSSRVTYGVAGRTMFDAPLVKNREAARSPAAVRSSRADHEQRRRWQADSTLMLTSCSLAERRCVHVRLRV